MTNYEQILLEEKSITHSYPYGINGPRSPDLSNTFGCL
jgi:hypothetical protein